MLFSPNTESESDWSCSNMKTHIVCGNLPAVGVHAGQEVDAGGVHQALDVGIARQVGRTQVVSQV
jgi:hypothetical protein